MSVREMSDEEIKEMLTDLIWSLEKARSWGNSKGNFKILDKAEKLLDKYSKLIGE
jgi:hypothetical protein